MRITVFGATGQVGRRIVNEALLRGHSVTAVGRSADRATALPKAALFRRGDASQLEDVLSLTEGQDLVINATRPVAGREKDVDTTTRVLFEGLARTGVRLLVAGGAASLSVPGTGRQVIDSPEFLPPSARHIGQASLTQFHICEAEERVDWAYLAPAANLAPGSRTGQFRLGRDELLLDESGQSRISMEDLAVAMLDEAERPQHHQRRFTVAY